MTEESCSKVISKKQQSKTIKGKLKRPTIKNNLCNPYIVKWPLIPEETAKSVKEDITRVFGMFELRNSTDILKSENPLEYRKFNRLKSSERKVVLQEHLKKRPQEELNLRRQLVCGFQAVMKSIEKDLVRLVLVDRDAWDMIKHMTQMTALRGCPGMAIRGLSKHLAPKLGLTTVSAIAFKKKSATDSEKFDMLVDSVAPRCLPIDIPWCDLENELQQIKDSASDNMQDRDPMSSEGNDQNESDKEGCASEDSSNEEETGAEKGVLESSSPSSIDSNIGSDAMNFEPNIAATKGFSHLYVPVSDCLPRRAIIFEEDGVECVRPKQDGFTKVDFVALSDNQESECSDQVASKRKSHNTQRKAKKVKPSKWHGPVLGKLQGNSERKKLS